MRRFHPLIVALCLLMPGAIATPASAQPAEQVVPGDPLAAAREALPRSLDRARELAEAELAAADATADPARRAAALAFLAGLELSARNEDRASALLDALDAVIADAPTLPAAAQAYYLRGRWLRDRREDAAAAAAFEQATARAAAAGDSATEAKALHAHAILLVRTGGQEKAEALLLRALALNETAGLERDGDANRHYLGLIARDRGDYSRAAALHAENLAHSERRGDQQGIANSANALGGLYAYRKEHAAAQRYFEQALAAYRAHGDRRGAAIALANIAEALNRERQFAQAEPRAREALTIASALGDADAEALARLILVNTLIGLDRIDDATVEANRAVELTANLPAADIRAAQALAALAATHLAQQRPAAALPLIQRALETARAVGRSPDVLDTLIQLAETELALGDKDSAYAHLKEALELVQATREEEMTRRIAELRAEHEAEKREAEIAAQQTRIEWLERQATQEQRIRYLMATALVSAVLLVLALISRARTKLRAERELRAQNALIERANAELAQAAETDALTQARNRRHFQRQLLPRLQLANQSGRAFALVLIDADRFKSINDLHGHDCGDAALVAIVGAWRDVLGSAGTLVRWGGEEFLAVIESATPEVVCDAVRRGLAAVRSQRVAGRDGPLSLSVSAGFVCGPWPGADIETLLRLADHALLAATRNGRARAYGIAPGSPPAALPEPFPAALAEIPGARWLSLA